MSIYCSFYIERETGFSWIVWDRKWRGDVFQLIEISSGKTLFFTTPKLLETIDTIISEHKPETFIVDSKHDFIKHRQSVFEMTDYDRLFLSAKNFIANDNCQLNSLKPHIPDIVFNHPDNLVDPVRSDTDIDFLFTKCFVLTCGYHTKLRHFTSPESLFSTGPKRDIYKTLDHNPTSIGDIFSGY